MSHMTTTEFLQEVNDALRSIDDDAPTLGTDEANYWLRVANRLVRNLARDTTKQWNFTYNVAEIGTITVDATPTFGLGDGTGEPLEDYGQLLTPANNVYVIDTDDHRHDFDLIEPQEKKDGRRQVYIAGKPQVLTFTEEIRTGEQIVGGTLYLPGYYLPATFGATGSSEVPVDDPDWLVLATASEIAFNDLTYEDKASDLNTKANALYSQMVKNNRRGSFGNPRKAQSQQSGAIRSY